MLRVQLLTIVLSAAVFFLIDSAGHNSDINPLLLRQTAQLTLILNKKKVTFSSKWTIQHSRVLLKAPALSQMPKLHNGCEVTSLAMLLDQVHKPVSKYVLAKLIKKDKTPIQFNAQGQIVKWGNPNYGFVGSISGKAPGYGVYHHPIAVLLNKEDPGQALDLTGSSFAEILATVTSGRPVIAWTTLTFKPVQDWITWQSPEGIVHATLYEHAVLIVGFDKNSIFINDPLTGNRAESVPLRSFEDSWIQMGRQAVTVK